MTLMILYCINPLQDQSYAGIVYYITGLNINPPAEVCVDYLRVLLVYNVQCM